MKSHRVSKVGDYLSPSAAGWKSVEPTRVALAPTPLPMQPTEYIQKSWEGKPYGQTPHVDVAVVNDSHDIALRMTWSGVSPAGKDFPDGLALAFPIRGEPVLALMGSADAPIHLLRWSAGKEGVRSILSLGIGTTQPSAAIKCSAKAVAESDTWSLVISRPLGTGKDLAPLVAGKPSKVGFAVWRGGNDERAGIKAFSIDWTALVLAA